LAPLVVILAQTPGWEQRAHSYGRSLDEALGCAKDLSEYAARAELLKRLTSLNDDILGVYSRTARMPPNHGQIELYWMVIGAVARLLDVDIEALTAVVMAHELAHALTHLGLDSNRSRWGDGFWNCDKGILEGLAQYYTHMTAKALKDERGYDHIWTAYSQLTNLQEQNGATIYVNHLEWVKTVSPEAMRSSLLELRRGHIKHNLLEFSDTLEVTAERYSDPSKKRGRA
jgi:hypothetical protein